MTSTMDDILRAAGAGDSSDDDDDDIVPAIIFPTIIDVDLDNNNENNNTENNDNEKNDNNADGRDDDSTLASKNSFDADSCDDSSAEPLPITFSDDSLAPPLAKWKEINYFHPIQITVSKSKRNMWLQAQEEINLVKSNIAELKVSSDVASVAATPMSKVYHSLFGSSSLLCGIFCRHLGIPKIKYLHFLFTYIISCKNQQSVATLFESMEINHDFLMPLEHYKNLWSLIKNQQGSLKELDFWKMIENATNQQLKQLFLSTDENFTYLVGYDDDKLHFDYSSNSKMSGLSPQHHVKDNRRGLTLHTCAFSATCVPVSVHFQRIGESVQDTYRRCVKEVFGIGRGGLDLHNVILASNRGYWEKQLLFQDMLDAGSNIVGTMKRVRKKICCVFLSFFLLSFFLLFFFLHFFALLIVVLFFLAIWLLHCSYHSQFFYPFFFCCVACDDKSEWFPLTFNHPNNKPFPEAPWNIPKEGYRDAFHLQTRWKGKSNKEKTLNAIAYRSSTGTAVALSFSTTNYWDMVTEKDKDLKWFVNHQLDPHERLMKGFDLLIGESCKPMELALLALVAPRSCGADGQGSKEWFLDRMFAGTSSQVHLLIEASAPLLMSNNDITGDEKKRSLRS